MTASQVERQAYVDKLAADRGYVLPYHQILAAQDFEALVAMNDLVSAVYLEQRALDPAVKELLFILSLTVMRAPKAHIQSHIRVGLQLGLDPREILEAIEISLPEAGVVAFQGGVDAWQEVVGAEMLAPSYPGTDQSAL